MYLHTKYDFNLEKKPKTNNPCGGAEAAARLQRAAEQGREGRALLAPAWLTSELGLHSPARVPPAAATHLAHLQQLLVLPTLSSNN